MVKLLVINSFGPMGSTLLAPVVEKIGFTSLPLRKNNLSEYLLGKVDLNCGLMQQRLDEILAQHSRPGIRGGVGKLARESQAPQTLIAYTDEIRKEVETLKERKFSSVQELYLAVRAVYAGAVSYKTVTGNPEWHIELTTDIHRFDPKQIYDAYKSNFDSVYMIHLTREFRGWFNSLASMSLRHNELKHRIIFLPHMRYNDYALYNGAMEQIPGLFIDFDDLFTTKTADLAAKIAEFADVPVPDIDFDSEKYDLYGKILPHDVAFKKFDDGIDYLRPGTLDYIAKQASQNRMGSKVTQLSSWALYLRDLLTYKPHIHKQAG